MRFLIKVLATLAGFIFTVGAPSKGSARELRSTTVGTVVLARENRNPVTAAGARSRFPRRGAAPLRPSQATNKRDHSKSSRLQRGRLQGWRLSRPHRRIERSRLAATAFHGCPT